MWVSGPFEVEKLTRRSEDGTAVHDIDVYIIHSWQRPIDTTNLKSVFRGKEYDVAGDCEEVVRVTAGDNGYSDDIVDLREYIKRLVNDVVGAVHLFYEPASDDGQLAFWAARSENVILHTYSMNETLDKLHQAASESTGSMKLKALSGVYADGSDAEDSLLLVHKEFKQVRLKAAHGGTKRATTATKTPADIMHNVLKTVTDSVWRVNTDRSAKYFKTVSRFCNARIEENLPPPYIFALYYNSASLMRIIFDDAIRLATDINVVLTTLDRANADKTNGLNTCAIVHAAPLTAIDMRNLLLNLGFTKTDPGLDNTGAPRTLRCARVPRLSATGRNEPDEADVMTELVVDDD